MTDGDGGITMPFVVCMCVHMRSYVRCKKDNQKCTPRPSSNWNAAVLNIRNIYILSQGQRDCDECSLCTLNHQVNKSN